MITATDIVIYYRIRLIWAIVWRYAAFALGVWALIAICGCAVNAPRTQQGYKDKAECEAAAAPTAGLRATVIYNDCMHGKGYK